MELVPEMEVLNERKALILDLVGEGPQQTGFTVCVGIVTMLAVLFEPRVMVWSNGRQPDPRTA